jgi:hypothetical protein
MSDQEANDLTCVDVEFISLVKHAASRLPFRVTKNDQEGGLIMDFFSLFKKEDELKAALRKDEGAASRVHAQAIAAARRLLEKDGFTIAKADDDDRLAEIEALKARLAELQGGAPQKTEDSGKGKRGKGRADGRTDGSGAAAGHGGPGVDDDEDVAGDPETGDDAKADARKMVKKLDDLGESLGAIGKLIEGIDARVAATERGLRKAEGKLRGTVPGMPVGDPEEIRIAKAAGEAPPLMDTGMHFND